MLRVRMCTAFEMMLRTDAASVNTTDLALPIGSEINPFVWRRSIAAQSKDFQVRIPS